MRYVGIPSSKEFKYRYRGCWANPQSINQSDWEEKGKKQQQANMSLSYLNMKMSKFVAAPVHA